MTTPLTAMIVDDEQAGIDYLKATLRTHCPNVQVVALAGTIEAARKQLHTHEPDLLFLDINLPDGSGFELLQGTQQNLHVVFTTAYDQFAVQAFRISAIDYLLKPVDPLLLQQAVSKAHHIHALSNLQQRIELLTRSFTEPEQVKTIVLRSAAGFQVVQISDIVRCQAESNYTKLFFADGSHFLASKNLKEFEATLSPHVFFRIHQSHLVNLQYVKAYHKGQLQELELTTGQLLPISRTKRKQFLEHFGQ